MRARAGNAARKDAEMDATSVAQMTGIGVVSTTLDSSGSSFYKPEVSPARAPGVLHRALAGMSMEPRRILPSGVEVRLPQRRGL